MPSNATQGEVSWVGYNGDMSIATVNEAGLISTNTNGKCGETVIEGINEASGKKVSIKVIVGTKCTEEVDLINSIWWAYENKKLTIGGSGKVSFFEPRDSFDKEQVCWKEISDSIEEIEFRDGISHIYVYFFNMKNLKKITIPNSVTKFDNFFDTDEEVEVYLPNNSEMLKDKINTTSYKFKLIYY